MATVAVRSIRELQRLQEERTRFEYNLLPTMPTAPAKVSASGLKFGYRIQWPRVDGVSGYRVAMMSANNLESPQGLSPLIWGEETQEHTWFYGDTTLVRQFTVQSFKASVSGEMLFSDFTRPFASATSKADGGAADAAPTAVAATPKPAGEATPGDPAGVPQEGRYQETT